MYIKLPDTYPYSSYQLRIDNPQTSFPSEIPDERLADWDVFPVTATKAPTLSPGEILEEALPIEIAGQWMQQWSIREPTETEILSMADSVRSERTRLLQESDWTQVADAPVDKVAWATYRQALRDVTAQPAFPTAVNWPAKPE